MASVKVSDIRQSSGGGLDIKAEILKYLPYNIPSVVLWTDETNRIYNEHCQQEGYYLYYREKEIVETQSRSICESIPDDSVLIELGSGSLVKTTFLLSELERQQKKVDYFALDIALEEMNEQLASVDRALEYRKYVTISGLLGTFDDCAEWIRSAYPSHFPKKITFLFLGSTAGNTLRDETSDFLRKFSTLTTSAGCECHFLFTQDGEEDVKVIEKAYSDLNGLDTPRKFMQQALLEMNKQLDYPAFDLNDWDEEAKFFKEDLMVRLHIISRRDVTVHVADKDISYKKGDKILCTVSGKWPEPIVKDVIKNAGMRLADVWKDKTGHHVLYHCVSDSHSP